MVAGWRVRVLVAHRRGRHLVVALRAGAGLVGALGRRGGVGRVLLCVVPAQVEHGGTSERHLHAPTRTRRPTVNHVASINDLTSLHWMVSPAKLGDDPPTLVCIFL